MSPYICAEITSTQVLTSKLAAFWVDKDTPKNTLHHLLESNLAPSHFEIITILALISVSKDRIEELHRLPTCTRASQAAESRLLKFIEEHKALLSPVRCLPSEIIQEIFLHYAASYADSRTGFLAKVPWHLGHISHRWREIALYLPSLWDDIPEIDMIQTPLALTNRSSFRGFTFLIKRSRTSPTLKFRIYEHFPGVAMEYPIISTIITHSERIEKLDIEVTPMTLQEFQGLKGHLPNLRDLRLTLHWGLHLYYGRLNLDIFHIVPSLRRLTLMGAHSDSTGLHLPGSQITHFEERSGIGLKYLPLSSLRSLIYLYINLGGTSYSEYTPSLLQPTTLPNLLILKIIINFGLENMFVEYLTVPAIEVIKISISDEKSLVPGLISMLSRSHQPSHLQKLAFRTDPMVLLPGELSALLELTPQLIELDIPVPPVQDIHRLTRCKGEGILVPMLQALYLDPYGIIDRTQAEYLKIFAQSRCELNGNDSEGDVIQNSLETLCINFGWPDSRDNSQKVLNNWEPVLNPQEVEAVKTFTHLHGQTVELRMAHVHYDLRRLIDFKLPVRGENKNKLKQRIMDMLDRWDRLLLNNLGDSGYWTRALPDRNGSLVYITKEKCRALRMSPDYLSIVYGLEIEGPRSIPLWNRI